MVLVSVEVVLPSELVLERLSLLTVVLPVLLVTVVVAVVLPLPVDVATVEEESIPVDDVLDVPDGTMPGCMMIST